MAEAVAEIFNQALALHQSGKLPEASALYKQVLLHFPSHADTLHLLGVTCLQSMEYERAIQHFQQAISAKPDHAAAYNNLGTAYNGLHHLNEAIEAYQHALSVNPDFADAHNNLGLAYSKLERFEEALSCYQRSLSINPQQAITNNNLAIAHYGLKQFELAISAYRQALAISPAYAEAYYGLGNAYSELKEYELATAAYHQAVAVKPEYAEAYNNLGNALSKLKRFEKAIPVYKKALVIDPGLSNETLNNLGNALTKLKHYDEAISCYRKAIAIDAQDKDAYNNLGNAFSEIKRFEDAMTCFRWALSIIPDDKETLNNIGVATSHLEKFDEALAVYKQVLSIDPQYGEAYNNLGNVLTDLKLYDDSITAYQNAISVKPDHAEAKWNLSLLLLSLGQLQQGFEDYESRWQCEDSKALSPTSYPRWLGDIPISGKKLLIQMEQGFGDAIQMVRYLPMLLDQGIDCYVQTPEPMMALMARSFPDVHFVDHKTTPDGMDLTIPIMSLPLAMKTFSEADIPSSAAYLVANVERVNYWQGALASSFRHRVGLVWRGNPNHSNDHHRSMPLAACLPLIINHSSIQFVTLQKDLTHEERELLSLHANVRMLDAELKDFDESAAVMMNLAAVISVDSAPAHLAAALGRPTWIPLCFRGEWRWLIDRDDSPWYPSATLFRQLAINDWAHVIQRLSLQLQRLG